VTFDPDTSLPRWHGITEPTTVATDVLLGGVAFVLGARLAYAGAAEGSVAASALALSMLAAAFSAAFGAAAHGLDPRIDRLQRDRAWRLTLYALGIVSVGALASVAFFAAGGGVRKAILVAAGIKLVAYVVRVARRPEFRVAAADYGGALAVLLAAAVYAAWRWRSPSSPWLVAGGLVSVIAGLVQIRRLALHRHFNHNDLYHVTQMVALYLFYRAGVLLVDR
jgi:hypothetical protein